MLQPNSPNTVYHQTHTHSDLPHVNQNSIDSSYPHVFAMCELLAFQIMQLGNLNKLYNSIHNVWLLMFRRPGENWEKSRNMLLTPVFDPLSRISCGNTKYAVTQVQPTSDTNPFDNLLVRIRFIDPSNKSCMPRLEVWKRWLQNTL